MLEGVLDTILAKKVQPQLCAVGFWVDSLSPEDRLRAIEIMDHPNVTAEDIVAELGDALAASTTTVRRHRRRACVCSR